MMPQNATSAPPSPMKAPTVNPSRRPMRFISSDAGTVVAIISTIWMPMGSVASTFVSASPWPIRAAAAIAAAVEVRKSAWQTASSATSRGGERVMADNTTSRAPGLRPGVSCSGPSGAGRSLRSLGYAPYLCHFRHTRLSI